MHPINNFKTIVLVIDQISYPAKISYNPIPIAPEIPPIGPPKSKAEIITIRLPK